MTELRRVCVDGVVHEVINRDAKTSYVYLARCTLRAWKTEEHRAEFFRGWGVDAQSLHERTSGVALECVLTADPVSCVMCLAGGNA